MAEWEYCALGFDPIPGEPAVILNLQYDARVFGTRMRDEAERLSGIQCQHWKGDAADLFISGIGALPTDLEKCGDAFIDLSTALGNYYERFLLARAEAAELDRRVDAARRTLRNLEAVVPPAGAALAPPDAAFVVAECELSSALHEAHTLAERFDESPEVEAIAEAIRALTKFAPDEPGWNVIRRWAGDVFKKSPIGVIAEPFHKLINDHAQFFSRLSDVFNDLSNTIGLLSLAMMFVPGVGPAFAVAALATSAASTGFKTSLYVGRARDQAGKLYVGRKELLRSAGDTVLNAGGIGMAGKASQAGEAALGTQMGLRRAILNELSVTKLAGVATPYQVVKEYGLRNLDDAYAHLMSMSALEWGVKSGTELRYLTGGAYLNVLGPVATSDHSNVAGLKAPVNLVTDTLERFRDPARPTDPDAAPAESEQRGRSSLLSDGDEG